MGSIKMVKDNADSFVLNIERLVGNICWGIIAGEGTGSNIAIDFGDKILRAMEIKNDSLSEEQRKYIGEFSLYVTCSWRLDSHGKVICSSKEPNRIGGPMIKGLRSIINKKVNDVAVLNPAFDLIVYFDKNLSLSIFCDETDPDDKFDNYSFFTPQQIFTITNRSELSVESR